MRKKIGKIISFITALSLLLLMSVVIAYGENVSGECGDNLTYTFDQYDYILTIEGTGKMTDYGGSGAPWKSWGVREVIIKDGVESIGKNAFYQSDYLTKVTLADSVKKIGESAFQYCTKITDFKFPQDLNAINAYAFASCGISDGVELSEGLISIGAHAFDGSDISGISMPDSVQSIGQGAFSNCTRLRNVKMPDGLQRIEEDTFTCCENLKSIIIPDSVLYIGYGAFSHSGLSDLTIPDSVTKIESTAFIELNSLSTISLPGRFELTSILGRTMPEFLTAVNVTSGDIVKNFARTCSSVANVSIGKKVTSIGEKAFYDCTNLKNVTIEADISEISADSFSGCINLRSISIPENIEVISAEAFNSCNRLKDIYYDSSRYKWRNVNINGNTAVEKATIHYLKTEPLAYRINSVTQTGNNVTIDITKDYKCDGPLLVATYNNRELVNVILSDINMNIGENKQISIAINDTDITDIAAFVWDSFDSMIPASNNCKKSDIE